ncbi:unnamed protein product, partial [Polarella glacialis]
EMKTSAITPHAFFFNEYLRCANESGEFERFRDILEQMKSHGLPENNGTQAQIRDMERLRSRATRPARAPPLSAAA